MFVSKWLAERAERWPWWIERFAKSRGTLLFLALHFITLYQMRNSFTVMELRNVGNRDHGLQRHEQACCGDWMQSQLSPFLGVMAKVIYRNASSACSTAVCSSECDKSRSA
jgi:hypothetical protein